MRQLISGLRFVVKDGKRILQQEVTLFHDDGDVMSYQIPQWEDVPLVEEP